MSDTEHALAADDLVAERYRVVGALGQGGMGTVYEAVNVVTGKPVALKMLAANIGTPEAKQRLLREAKLTARVHHPHVIDIYDVGFDGDAMFLVMELLRGRPLDVWIAERAPVSVEELLVLAQQTFRGLAVLHAEGIVHRDIKPSNVFVLETENEPSRAKLLDLGIARDGGSQTITITNPNQIIGTPAYMAPEQLERPDQVDARTDVYACGVLLYEALAGERPFVGESLTLLVMKILGGHPVPLEERRSDLPEGLSDVVARAMSLDPADRYADASALVEALSASGSAEASSAQVAKAPKRAPGWAMWLSVVVLVAITVGMLMTLGPEEGTAPGPSDSPTTPVDPAGGAPASEPRVPEPDLPDGRDLRPESTTTLTDPATEGPAGATAESVRPTSPARPARARRGRRADPPARPREELAPPDEPASPVTAPADPSPAQPTYLDLDPEDF